MSKWLTGPRRSAGGRMIPVPFRAAAATRSCSSALVLSRPRYCASAPFAGVAPVNWCQPTTVLPYLATTGCTRSLNLT
ncbi:hypothetical protein AQJ91_15345 [Streptomyces dysideae]|uniref:Uncharacterized protein n=1 Tax=Streptomyces dysideae TaxID=909626 RepID=A0A101V093_9ACTN|nr:hypothetical protein AQJ91_15345 [Streptomyces dysideae]